MPTYELQALLDLRRRAEDEAERALAGALAALAEAKRQQEELDRAADQATQRAREERRTRLAVAPLDAAHALTVQRYLERLRALAEAAKGAAEAHRQGPLAGAEVLVSRERERRLEARREREAIEKHRERREDEHRKERERRDELAADDLTSATHRRR